MKNETTITSGHVFQATHTVGHAKAHVSDLKNHSCFVLVSLRLKPVYQLYCPKLLVFILTPPVQYPKLANNSFLPQIFKRTIHRFS